MAVKEIKFEDAKIIFKNFSGKEKDFNRAGDRNFCILLSQETADELIAQGLNIKSRVPNNDPEGERIFYLPTTVKYNEYYSPKIYIIANNKKTLLEEENVNILDWAEIETLDIVVRLREWEVAGKTGIKAYVKSMYATIVLDEFEEKYANISENEEVPFDE